MPVSSEAVGSVLGQRVASVTARQILAYAAGLGTDDPKLLDDADEALCALPQFCVVLEWPVISDPAVRRILGLTHDETIRGVHVSQDSTFHAPIRPGATVRTGCRMMAVRATSAGALVRCLLETVDEVNGEPLVSSWSTSIYRGVAVQGPDHAVAQPPAIPSSGERSSSGDEVEIPIARWLPHVYTECSAIWNPIHTERRVALRAGLADILLHGTATWALAGLAVVERRGRADPRRLRRLAGRFAAPVLPGSVLRVSVGPLSAAQVAGVAFVASSDGGARVLDEGWAELA